MIPFVKAQACGNDFLIVKTQDVNGTSPDSLARRLCSRHCGVGADGIELLSAESKSAGVIHLFNADGSAAEISGNGTRCVAAWMAYEAGLGPGARIALTTDAGLRNLQIISRNEHRFEIASAMGVPEVRKHSVRLRDGSVIEGAAVATGNPHFVIFATDTDFRVSGIAWKDLGAQISAHPEFPHRTNVEFVRRTSAMEIEIRIFERGVGPTTSSGTGSCAAAAASIQLLGLAADLGVTAPGGRQTVRWNGPGSEMLLTGPAELVCQGAAFPPPVPPA